MSRIKIKTLLIFSVFIVAGLVAGFFVISNRDDTSLKSELVSTDYEGITFRVNKEESNTHNIHVMYPITPNDKINKDAEVTIDDYISSFRNKLADRSSRNSKVWDLNITGDIDYHTDRIINFVYNVKQYTGDVDNIEVNRLYDIQSGDRVRISDLFKDDSYLKVLSDESRKQLPATLGTNYLEELAKKGTTADSLNFSSFELNDQESFTVVFEPGQVAPVEVGIVKIKIKMAILSNNLNDNTKGWLKKVAEAINTQAKKDQSLAQKALSAPVQSPTGNTDCSIVKCLAITFDDGPGRYGNELLDLLDKHNVKASFFYIGRQVAGYSSEVKRAHNSGHDIGNHTWDHANMKHQTNLQLQKEVEATSQAIMQATGVRPILLRPPYGAYNEDQVGLLKMPFILWNVDPDDWRDKDANTIYDRVMSAAGDGKVVLSHEIYPTTIEAYRRAIPDLLGQGYRLVTITDLFDIDSSKPDIRVYKSR